MLPLLSFFEEFDFDDEPERKERRMPRLPRLGRSVDDEEDTEGGGPRRPTGPQWQRIGLLALVLVVFALVGYWQLTSCQRDAEVRSYKNYVKQVNALSAQAKGIGTGLETAFIKQNQTSTGIVSDVRKLAAQQQTIVDAAQKVHTPGAMGTAQVFLVESETLRRNALNEMVRALGDAFASADKKNKTGIPQDRVATVSLLLGRVYAGDVVFSDSYEPATAKVLADKTIRGARLDDSAFMTKATFVFIDPGTLKTQLDAFLPTSTTTACASGDTTCTPNDGKVHGTSIDGATLAPSGIDLDPAATVDAQSATGGSANKFEIKITNGGCCAEFQIKVTALLDGKTIGTQTIAVLTAGAAYTASFPFTPVFSGALSVHTLQVDVKPVPHETNTANNTAKYKVRFKLSGT